MEVCCTGHVKGLLSDIHQLMACVSTLTNIQCATLHSTGLPGLKVTLGKYRGSLVSVHFCLVLEERFSGSLFL